MQKLVNLINIIIIEYNIKPSIRERFTGLKWEEVFWKRKTALNFCWFFEILLVNPET